MADIEKTGERIAKFMARSGVASRRGAEALIAEGKVKVNGKVITSPALNVTDKDDIRVDNQSISKPPLRLWRYHKPAGLVTTAKDEKGRTTVFDELPKAMGRVMSVGRLDLTSEGLLLLTNDGELKRQLELPETGWKRKYRVRAYGKVKEAALDILRNGVRVDGEDFQPMDVVLDKEIGGNQWFTVGLREGKNREIRRAFTQIGLEVNRLIRVSYGPFQIGDLPRGAVEEVRPKIIRTQLGKLLPKDVVFPDSLLELEEKPKPNANPVGKAPSNPSARTSPKAQNKRAQSRPITSRSGKPRTRS